MGWGIWYTIKDGGCTILRCVGDGAPLRLPESIDGAPVRALGPDCFAAGVSEPGLFDASAHPLPPVLRADGNLTRLTLPESLTEIGPRAFARCRELKRLELPALVRTLGQRAFEASGLERLTLPEGLTELPDYAFAQCRALKRLDLPESLTSVGHHAFYNCRSLEALVLPDGVGFVGESVFQNCGALQRLTAPLGVNLGVILSDLQEALTLTVHCPDGEARIYLPGFSYEYESITAPRVWRTITYGAGQLYRECFSSRDIDFELYEAHFRIALLEDRLEDTVRVALCRLRWPYRLNKGREAYLTHLTEHWDTALDLLMDEDDLEGLEALLTLVRPDAQTMDRLTARARARNKVLFLSRLLEEGMGRPRSAKTFEL